VPGSNVKYRPPSGDPAGYPPVPPAGGAGSAVLPAKSSPGPERRAGCVALSRENLRPSPPTARARDRTRVTFFARRRGDSGAAVRFVTTPRGQSFELRCGYPETSPRGARASRAGSPGHRVSVRSASCRQNHLHSEKPIELRTGHHKHTPRRQRTGGCRSHLDCLSRGQRGSDLPGLACYGGARTHGSPRLRSEPLAAMEIPSAWTRRHAVSGHTHPARPVGGRRWLPVSAADVPGL